MSIKFTCGDLKKLGDLPGQPGPLTKIAKFEDLSSVVDHIRRVRFIKALQPEISDYNVALKALARKYSEDASAAGTTAFSIKPPDKEAYEAERAKIDAEPREILVNPLPISAYEKIPLSALDIIALEPFIELPSSE